MPVLTAIILINGLTATARLNIRARFAGRDRQAGAATLETAVIALGLVLIAGVLVAAITNAVNRRVEQIN